MLDELRRRQDHLARIRQARKEMEAETAAAAARQRIEEAEDVTTKATAAQDTESPDAPICRATTASWLSTATTSCSWPNTPTWRQQLAEGQWPWPEQSGLTNGPPPWARTAEGKRPAVLFTVISGGLLYRQQTPR